MTTTDPRVSVVVLTHERTQELERTLRHLEALPERPALIVVDNAASSATAEVVRRFERAHWVPCPGNPGAAGRNHGMERVCTPYVAFCDDDSWWEPGALARAAAVQTHHHPSAARDRRARQLATTRNRFWLAWLRLPWRLAWHETRQVWRDGQAQGVLSPALWAALRGLPWALAHRRVLPPTVLEMIVQGHGGPPPARRHLAVMPGGQR